MHHITLLIALLGPLAAICQQWNYQGTYWGISVPLDSILVENLSQGGDTWVYTDDSLGQGALVGLEELSSAGPGGITLLPGYPNPFHGHTTFGLSMQKPGDVTLLVFDATGRSIVGLDLDHVAPGVHGFQFNGPHVGVYFVSAFVGGVRQVLRLIQLDGYGQPGLLYTGTAIGVPKDGERDNFPWAPGDLIRHTAYATLQCNEQARHVVVDVPEFTENYIMPLVKVGNAPCLITDRDSIAQSVACVGDTSTEVFHLVGENLGCNSITIGPLERYRFGLGETGPFLESVDIPVPANDSINTSIRVLFEPEDANEQTPVLEMTCGSAQATVQLTGSVDFTQAAGTNGTLTICAGTTVAASQLFAQLGGSPQTGGTWSPALAGAGVYTYTVAATAPCTGIATATVTVSAQAAPNAGTTGTLTICTGTSVTASQLFAQLGGSPQSGGTWSPTLAGAGVYTYTVAATAPCTGTATATVQVSAQAAPNAGTNGTLTICAGTTVNASQLFAQLGGSPQGGGSWSPALAGAGPYTYTVTAPPCPNDVATITVTESTSANAGLNGILVICSYASPVDLIDQLGGTPDANGSWSGPSTVTNGQYDPATMNPGSYIYSVTATPPCTSSTATVVVSEPPCPLLTTDPLTLDYDTICVGLTEWWALPRRIFSLTGTELEPGPITIGPTPGAGFTDSPIGVLQDSLILQWGGGSGVVDGNGSIFVGFSPSSSGPFNVEIPIRGGGAEPIYIAATGIGSDAAPVADLIGYEQVSGNYEEAVWEGSFEDTGCRPVDGSGFEVSSSPDLVPFETYWATGGASSFTATIPVVPGTPYWIRAFAFYGGIRAYSDVEVWTAQELMCPTVVTDANGNEYDVVRIGNQCWTAENLRASVYSDLGTEIPEVSQPSTAWMANTTGAWCNHGNNPNNDAIYGKLYNWYAIENGNICPVGWRVPSDDDWKALEDTLGVPEEDLDRWGFDRGNIANVGGQLKSTTVWNLPNSGADDSSDFSALPGGNRYGGPHGEFGTPGLFYNLGENGFWWSSSAFDGEPAQGIAADPINKGWSRYLHFDLQGISRFDTFKKSGLSVRCVKN